MSHQHCREYHAAAGAGLPAIEHGMPAPAGTGLSRRSFLLRSAGLALSVYGGAQLAPQALAEGIAAAAEADAGGRILVNVFFGGGLDSIGVLGPYGTGRYADLRGSLSTPTRNRTPLTFAAAGGWFWHPDAAPLKRLHEAGKLAIIPSVGYTDPNQSHFTSRHFWEVGATDVLARTGWMGRYLDQPGVGRVDNPLQGLTVGQSLVPSLASGTMPVAAVENPALYRFDTLGVWREDLGPAMYDALAKLAQTPSNGDPVLAQAKFAQANASNVQEALEGLDPLPQQDPYPVGIEFGQRLRNLAHMIDAGLPIKCAGLIANGDYDTHANQAAGFEVHLPKALGSLETFQADLEARGIADRVLTLVWSEFGRRPEENGSGGTDHGASAIGFVLGTNAAGYQSTPSGRSGLVGAWPKIGAADLDVNGNIRHDVDFRDVYGSVLDQWLGADPEAILGKVKTDLPVVR
jgi:uncharacterized protein (DUF1501 family)